MSSQNITSEVKMVNETYPLNRDQVEKDRFNLQHNIIKKSFNFLIHPTILTSLVANASDHTIRIADFATGTAIWPLEVAALFAEQYPNVKVKIYGSDISSAQFPPAEELPHNVVLKETDILHRSEKHVTEKYDFIHIRAMVLVLADHEWKRVLENLEQRLKPGGYIQWVDADLTTTGWKCISHKAWASHLKRSLASSNDLWTLFEAAGIQDIQQDILQIDGDHELRTAFTVEVVEAASSIITSFAKLLNSEDDSISIEDAENAGREMVACAKEGVYWTRVDFNVVVGKKPVYFTKTIVLPQVRENDTNEQKLLDDLYNLPEVEHYNTAGPNNQTYAVKNVGGGLAKVNVLSLAIPKEVIPAVIDGISLSPVADENIQSQETYFEEKIVAQDLESKATPAEQKKLAPHDMEVQTPGTEQKKPLLRAMNAAAPSFEQRQPLPHEITSTATSTQQPKKLLPHEVSTTDTTTLQTRKLLPHERAVASSPAVPAQKLLPHER